jgi:hypothetical protein
MNPELMNPEWIQIIQPMSATEKGAERPIHNLRPLASPSPGGEGRGEGELTPAEARGSDQII